MPNVMKMPERLEWMRQESAKGPSNYQISNGHESGTSGNYRILIWRFLHALSESQIKRTGRLLDKLNFEGLPGMDAGLPIELLSKKPRPGTSRHLARQVEMGLTRKYSEMVC
jgi:hypothetical protein